MKVGKLMKDFLSKNTGYKVVALFITLILWLTILGRRDFVMTRELPVHFLLPERYQFFKKPVETVKVQISGTRHALKKLSRDIEGQAVVIDLAEEIPGRIKKKITSDMVDLPLGANLIWVDPQFFTAIIVDKPSQNKEDDQ